MDKSQHYAFLFIGNSYTYYNEMPEQLFSNTLKEAARKAVFETPNIPEAYSVSGI